MNILLGMTGSVATTLAPKLVQALSKVGNVRVVVTESAKYFYDHNELINLLMKQLGVSYPYLLDDKAEWEFWKKKGDPIEHIDMAKWADVLVIAPLTANTLAKMANGICDNLLTCLYRAWDLTKPIVIAPSMNTKMWEHPLTGEHLLKLDGFNPAQQRYVHYLKQCKHLTLVEPVVKKLACGDIGKGGMGDISDIVKVVESIGRWSFPLEGCFGVPVSGHPGSFGYVRRHDVHTGVDLYTHYRCPVTAMERGEVIRSIPFTGSALGHTWWNDTDALLVRGRSGVICYGEIEPQNFQAGDIVIPGQIIGEVVPVVMEGRERPDIPGHSRSMLHIELYQDLYLPNETTDDLDRGIWRGWNIGEPQPGKLLDPTAKLLECKPEGVPELSMPKIGD